MAWYTKTLRLALRNGTRQNPFLFLSKQEYTTDESEAQEHKQNLPQPVLRYIYLVRQHLEESDVEECSSCQPLQDTVTNITGEAVWQVGDGDTDEDTDGAGQREQDVGPNKGFAGQVRCGNIQSQTEGHNCLVHDNPEEEGDQGGVGVLQSKGQTLKDRVEWEGEEQDNAAQGAVLEDAVVYVTVVSMSVERVMHLIR